MKNIIIALVIIIIGFVAGWFIVRPKSFPQLGSFQKNTPVASPTPVAGTYNPVEVPVSGVQSQTGETKGGIQTQNSIVTETQVSYKDDGFHESVIYVKLGSTVVFKNDSGRDLWVVSTPQPAYPEFNQKKSVSRGGSYSYTFVKVGAWKYYNQVMPNQTGTVVVQQ